MDIAALRDEGFSVWMPFMDAEVHVAYVSSSAMDSMRQEATVRRLSGGELSERLDRETFLRLLGAKAVLGWRGITQGGAVFEYSVANAQMLMTRWGAFAAFVTRACSDVQALHAASLQESKKTDGPRPGPTRLPRAQLCRMRRASPGGLCPVLR